MSKQNKIVSYCSYCKEPIWEGQEMVKIGEDYYHASKINPLLNCWFEEEAEE